MCHLRAESIAARLEGVETSSTRRQDYDIVHLNGTPDAIAQLDRQTLQQRLEELHAKKRDGELDESDKNELRMLLQSRFA